MILRSHTHPTSTRYGTNYLNENEKEEEGRKEETRNNKVRICLENESECAREEEKLKHAAYIHSTQLENAFNTNWNRNDYD